MIPARPDDAEEPESTDHHAPAVRGDATSPDEAPGAGTSAGADQDLGEAPAALPGAAGAAAAPLASQASGPAMMVFGPLLAVSALEYLFLGDQLRGLFSLVFGGEP